MANDSEMIRRQMAETRTALSDKLERLERRVVDTVEGASCAMNETVSNVRDAVQDSVATVKDSVRDTVDTVRDAFDISRQVNAHPWTVMAGAVAVGFISGYMLNRAAADHLRRRQPENILEGGWTNGTEMQRSPHNGLHVGSQDSGTGASAEQIARADGSGATKSVGQTFEKELGQLRGLAIGAMFGLIRDIAKDSVPEPMELQIGEVIDGITEKLGGQPIHGRILPKTIVHDKHDAAREAERLSPSDAFADCSFLG